MLTRFVVHIQGQVQGVGFRPYVYRLATQLQLIGWVKNHSQGVTIEIQGHAIEQFFEQLPKHLPPLAKISNITTQAIPVQPQEKDFKIITSTAGLIDTQIIPDACTCNDCLTELFDPNSRFYHYPFINCTHCGPRFSITTSLPYDRNNTSMAHFIMCADCEENYKNPNDRRYHAQPIACPACGPQLSQPIAKIAADIKAGKIIALKNLGGYQLICDAHNHAAVQRLRTRKERSDKPFAIMLANLASAHQYTHIDENEAQLLTSQQRPIVLLTNKQPERWSVIAPGLNTLGVMLPYTPTHYLLFNTLCGDETNQKWLTQAQTIALVVTSANPGGCPLITNDTQAQQQLATIANEIIYFNRDIVTRCDDSVLQRIQQHTVFIRRARGYAPTPIELPHAIPPTLALGAHLKNTICLTRGPHAFVSQHLGDLNDRFSIEFLHETIAHFIKIVGIHPKRIAHDMHPDFYTTSLASEFDLPCFAVQHHHAHLAAVAAEYHITQPCLGLALDGYGFGDDGGAWGGELCYIEGPHCTRLGSLQPFPLPGGDRASHEPWRVAVSLLQQLGLNDIAEQRFAHCGPVPAIQALSQQPRFAPLTSSCGRLFDGVSALLGICLHNGYEAQAAMQLESQVTQLEVYKAGWQIHNNQLNLLALLRHLIDQDATTGANLFHGTLATALTDWIIKNSQRYSSNIVLLAGGCLLNRVLAQALVQKLKDQGLHPLLPQQIPVNDGGISLGQAWVAGMQN